jgi:Tol biopolymer transport system component
MELRPCRSILHVAPSLQRLTARRVLLTAVLALLAPALASAQPATARVSEGSGGIQANRRSRGPAISADGRWVAFDSSASNLVPGDTNDTHDVFLHDRQTGTTTRVSVSTGGAQGNDVSHSPSISADGRWVAFESAASTLVADDTNHLPDVFVHDRFTGTTRRVSVGTDGAQGNLESANAAISADGRWVAFGSLATNLVADDANGESDVFVHDLVMGTTTRVSLGPAGVEGNGGSGWPAMSADGRWVAFSSLAGNLVPDDTNGVGDTFVHDRQTGITTRVSLDSAGVEANDWSHWAPAISGDGRRVAFQSSASNLVAGDTNGHPDVFVHDRQTGTTTCASVGPGGAHGDTWSEFPAISTDGRWVVFESPATNLVAGDTNSVADVFVYDVQTGTLTRVSVGPGDGEADRGSGSQAISADGRWVAFGSWATNLIADDTNGYEDVFVHDRAATTPVAPGGLVVESVVGDLVTLRWTNPAFGPSPTHFVVEGGTTAGSTMASSSTESTAPTFTFTAPEGSFFGRVHAVSGAFWSSASNEVQIHVNVALAPSPPANLLGLVNESTLALAWRNTYDGGAPTSFVLDVTGAITTSLPLGFGDSFALAGVPAGTYTLSLRALNAAGSSSPSNALTLTFPGPCSGPPAVPADVRAYHVGRTVNVAWSPGTSGPAPTAYALIVTGQGLSTFVTRERALSGAVGPGTYTLSVLAVNACGVSAGGPSHTIVVP